MLSTDGLGKGVGYASDQQRHCSEVHIPKEVCLLPSVRHPTSFPVILCSPRPVPFPLSITMEFAIPLAAFDCVCVCPVHPDRYP